MNDWFNILKVQILDTTTDLNIDMEPMTEDKDEDCCKNAFSQFEQMEDDMKNYHEDLLAHSSELKGEFPFRSVISSLSLNIDPHQESTCEFFYAYLNIVWGRLGRFLIDLPTTTNNLWKRGHEIKNQLHEIMQEWEECDGEIAYPAWSKYRGEMFSELV